MGTRSTSPRGSRPSPPPEASASPAGSIELSTNRPCGSGRPVPQRLKNIPEPVDVYEFADLPGDEARAAGLGSVLLDSPTVAVLPIHTEQVGDDVKAIGGIIRADLLHRLSTLPGLKLIDAGPVPGGSPPPASARYVLETGIHQVGERLRVFATLLDVTTMNIVKTHKWDATTADVLDLSDRISEEVVRSVEVDLVVGAPAGLYAELDDPVAIEQVYLGWYYLESDTPEGWAKSLDYFGAVAASHPEQPYGHVLLAFAYWIGASNDWVPDVEAALSTAWEHAEEGTRVGDATGMGMVVIAAVLMSRGRFDEAVDELERVEITRPTCDATYGLEGERETLPRANGRWRSTSLDIAMRLTGVQEALVPTVKSCSLFIGGRLEQAASLAEMVLEHQPNNLEALLVLTAARSSSDSIAAPGPRRSGSARRSPPPTSMPGSSATPIRMTPPSSAGRPISPPSG